MPTTILKRHFSGGRKLTGHATRESDSLAGLLQAFGTDIAAVITRVGLAYTDFGTLSTRIGEAVTDFSALATKSAALVVDLASIATKTSQGVADMTAIQTLINGIRSSNGVIDGSLVTTPTTPSAQTTGAAETDWNINIPATSCCVNGVAATISAANDYAVHDTTQLVTNGQSCVAAIIAVESGGSLSFSHVKGSAATTGSQVAPTDAAITTAVGHANWTKLAECTINRTGDTTVTQSQDNSKRHTFGNWTRLTAFTPTLAAAFSATYTAFTKTLVAFTRTATAAPTQSTSNSSSAE